MQNKNVVIIGAGIGGLATAALLAKEGYNVAVYEKNEKCGGRANFYTADGFTFDMGPSWYLMPDVFENFFGYFNKNVSEYLDLIQLAPSYRVFFKDQNKQVDVFAEREKVKKLFEEIEPGASEKLEQFIEKSKQHYRIAMDEFVYKNYNSLFDFFSFKMIREALNLNILSTMQKYVEKYFKNQMLQQLVQYQLVFLGNSPYNAPAIYNIMTHVDFDMGVFYPRGGMYKISEALMKLAEEQGVLIHTNSPVKHIVVKDQKAVGIIVNNQEIAADIVIANADYEHTERSLLDTAHRSFSDSYWDKRVLAPSGLVLYLGFNEKLKNVTHHNLIFSKNWQKNFSQIFDTLQWPDDPSLYFCVPSIIDPEVAPEGKENVFVFVPIAADLKYDDAFIEMFSAKMIQTIGEQIGDSRLASKLIYKKIFCVEDFKERYNSYRGSALGLAHTLMQTAVFRPDNRSKKVKDLYYVGGNTNPGIGVPICLISAELVKNRIIIHP